MKVILNQDIPNIGEEGDIADVARGYARNYLIPKKMVLPYTRDALAMLESRRETIEQRRAEKLKLAQDVKTRLETEALELTMPAGDRGRLFGSVTSATIAEALAAKGIDVERKRIDIPEKTIKTTGTAYVRVRLYGDEEAELRVNVSGAGGQASAAAAEESESKPQAATEPKASEETAPEADTATDEAVAADEESAVADEETPKSEDTP
jgi:large subunit ribosomal protein L9